MQYDVGTDGAVSFPSSCNGFLSLGGPDSLIVRGYPILVDATQADADLLSIVNIPILAEARHYVFAVLLPADNYVPQTAHGVFSHAFNVKRDSTITFDAAVAARYVVTTIPDSRSGAPPRSDAQPPPVWTSWLLASRRGKRRVDDRDDRMHSRAGPAIDPHARTPCVVGGAATEAEYGGELGGVKGEAIG
jgi:hypothetical protein